MSKSPIRASKPVEILVDTDMATDCDDAGALAVLHALATAGEAHIAAIVVNNLDPASTGAVAAINAFCFRATLSVTRSPPALDWLCSP